MAMGADPQEPPGPLGPPGSRKALWAPAGVSAVRVLSAGAVTALGLLIAPEAVLCNSQDGVWWSPLAPSPYPVI